MINPYRSRSKRRIEDQLAVGRRQGRLFQIKIRRAFLFALLLMMIIKGAAPSGGLIVPAIGAVFTNGYEIKLKKAVVRLAWLSRAGCCAGRHAVESEKSRHCHLLQRQ